MTALNSKQPLAAPRAISSSEYATGSHEDDLSQAPQFLHAKLFFCACSQTQFWHPSHTRYDFQLFGDLCDFELQDPPSLQELHGPRNNGAGKIEFKCLKEDEDQDEDKNSSHCCTVSAHGESTSKLSTQLLRRSRALSPSE